MGLFPFCWLFGLRNPSTGTYRLLSRADSNPWEGSHKEVLPQTATPSVFGPLVSHSQPCLCKRPSNNQVGLIQSLMRSLLFSLGFWCARDIVDAFQEWHLCFPRSHGFPMTKLHWLSKPDFLGTPPIVRPLDWKDLTLGSGLLTPVNGLLWNNCYPVYGLAALPVWNLILRLHLPTIWLWLLHYLWMQVFFFSFWWWWISVFFVDGCSAVSYDFGVYLRKVKLMSLLFHLELEIYTYYIKCKI